MLFIKTILFFKFLILVCYASISLNIGEEENKPFDGRICAYGDFDKDRYTDLLIQRGNKLEILMQSELGHFSESENFEAITLEKDAGEVFCTVGDFDGDTQLDVLVTKVNIL